ncbi:MAG: 4-(cytidine 5'-diphospho)-2-C-methyl-D-erythritol kinase [Peptococcaceae bacterium]|jgi:4-diphosphocytidyl-2-C-methyl-D-erythritol kinase|nr:4-(cytidine 5'-diphospho)-2-C-methyl-D-erythritol kinase [Peptococcaceae bacterium]
MESYTIKLLAPAKINLALAVKNKRADGMHSLETIFQTVSLYDRIEVALRDGAIICHCGELSGEKNLAYQAAVLFLDKYQSLNPLNSKVGMEITIEKKIPHQAGLAGGSSDAAAVLKALNVLFAKPFSYHELCQLAQQCGSDTAFFLKGGTQWGEGTGSELTELPSAPEMDLIIVKPERGVDTAAAYRTFDEIGVCSNLCFNTWQRLLVKKDVRAIGEKLFNSLEIAAFKLVPEIKEIKNILKEKGCQGVLMSGSGSAVFGLLQDVEQGKQIIDALKAAGFLNNWLVRTIAGNSDNYF